MGLYLVEAVLIFSASLLLCSAAFRLFKGNPSNQQDETKSDKDDKAV